MTKLAAGRLLFWTLVVAIAIVTLCPIALRPQTGHVLLERAGAFFLLGVSSLWAFPYSRLRALVGVQTLAVGLELAQAIVPGRHGRWLDAMEKMGGGLAGGLATLLVIGAMMGWAAARGQSGVALAQSHRSPPAG